MNAISRYMSAIGKKGGSVKSERKANASRNNGRLAVQSRTGCDDKEQMKIHSCSTCYHWAGPEALLGKGVRGRVCVHDDLYMHAPTSFQKDGAIGVNCDFSCNQDTPPKYDHILTGPDFCCVHHVEKES
jgi:hypothetical protein